MMVRLILPLLLRLPENCQNSIWAHQGWVVIIAGKVSAGPGLALVGRSGGGLGISVWTWACQKSSFPVICISFTGLWRRSWRYCSRGRRGSHCKQQYNMQKIASIIQIEKIKIQETWVSWWGRNFTGARFGGGPASHWPLLRQQICRIQRNSSKTVSWAQAHNEEEQC